MRRRGFTLVEMLVATALVLFIMVILTEAFSKGLESFRRLKALGDLEARLRAATALLRRDLAADHFEGRRRLSDPAASVALQGRPREGFFSIAPAFLTVFPIPEGFDADGISSERGSLFVLHFSVKLRGNERGDFFSARVPANAPLLAGSSPRVRTTFFDQPADARYEDSGRVYRSQWAEVAYFLVRTGTTLDPGDGFTPPGPEVAPVYALYRSQFVVVADNSQLNWPTAPVPGVLPVPAARQAEYLEMSCTMDGGALYFNSPADLLALQRRVFYPRVLPQDLRAATLLLTDVISFDVQVLSPGLSVNPDFAHLATSIDTANGVPPILALKVTLRVWDPKTKVTRQVTLIQDM